jgi:putative spermidine/putrescine transport system ATP-binding protein
MASEVSWAGVSKSFGASIALQDFSLHVESGELMCLLGPSGCGKTTALRIVAGFESPDSGHVTVGSEDITRVAVENRNFGMVFQDYSLFPNMTAEENIEFGLRTRKWSKAERSARVSYLLEVTHLTDQAAKYPDQMSGGQKQRVALARAIAPKPRVLLLDEPLSALDAKVRESLREEIRSVQQTTGITTIFVTHDQSEALAIADRVAVMSHGRLEQVSTPRELYEDPTTPFVARFVGSTNLIEAVGLADGKWSVLQSVVAASRPATAGEIATALVRPEHLLVEAAASSPWQIHGTTFAGPITRLGISNGAGRPIEADVLSTEAGELVIGARVTIGLRKDVTQVMLAPNS